MSLHTKFEVYTFTHYENMKDNANCRNWGSFGTPKVTGNVII